MHTRRFAAIGLFLACAVLWNLSVTQAGVKPTGKVKAFVGILPIAYFVERVGGPLVEVNVLVKPGQNPHTFEPTPKLAAKLADAQVLFTLGFPFEQRISKKLGSTFKKLEIVDLQQGIKLQPMNEAHGHHHGEGDHHKHSHGAGEPDRHSWLDPQLVKIQAGTIAKTLMRIDPSHRAQYEKNLKDFQNDLDAVDEQLTKALAPVKGKSFFVFHPAYGYFGRAYGLKQIAVESGGKEPTAKQLVHLIELAKSTGVRVIFVQPQFSERSADALAKAINGAVVPLDPLARDYLENLRKMAAKLESAL